MKRIRLPLVQSEIDTLQAGDAVLLSGTLYTARDAAHKKLAQMMENGETLPMELDGCTIYYVGPTPGRPDQVIGSAGPTTSSRMDPYVPLFMDHGMKGMIGKGRRSPEVIEAVRKHKGIYFVCTGGAGALLSHSIVSRKVIAFPELLAEAVTELEVVDFPCFVGLDIHGNDIYDMED